MARRTLLRQGARPVCRHGLRPALLIVAALAVISLAVLPASAVPEYGDVEQVVDCGASLTHASNGSRPEERVSTLLPPDHPSGSWVRARTALTRD